MLRVWSVLDILTWNKRDLEEKYISFRIHYCTQYKLQVFIKFSYLGDHVLPTKLRSERCANDLNHFQLKVPSGTFSIAEIHFLRTHQNGRSCTYTLQETDVLVKLHFGQSQQA